MIYLKFLLISVLLIALAGCGGTFKPPEGGEKPVEKPRVEGKYDPLGQSEDLVIVPAVVSLNAVSDTVRGVRDSVSINITEAVSAEGSVEQSYRIQLFTSKEYGSALREKNVATEVFDYPVTLDYEVPYYKVRVGSFATHEEAESYLPAATEAGYKTAWIVRAYKNVRTIEDIYENEAPLMINGPDSTDMEFETVDDVIEYMED